MKNIITVIGILVILGILFFSNSIEREENIAKAAKEEKEVKAAKEAKAAKEMKEAKAAEEMREAKAAKAKATKDAEEAQNYCKEEYDNYKSDFSDACGWMNDDEVVIEKIKNKLKKLKSSNGCEKMINRIDILIAKCNSEL